MGQYWKAVNLTKKEFIHPHKLGSGLKLWEQLANDPGIGAALIILCAAMPAHRGGGDLDLSENWHGPERKFPEHNSGPAPMSEVYEAIAHRTIGRWAGDQIALVGDYAEDSDLAPEFKASTIYNHCVAPEDLTEFLAEFPECDPATVYTDITADVARVIEHELQGKYEGDGWRTFVRSKAA